MFHRGDFVTINSRVGVIVIIREEMVSDPEDNAAGWFGNLKTAFPKYGQYPLST